MKKGLFAILVLGFCFSSLQARAEGDQPVLDQPEVTKDGNYEISANWSELKRAWNTLTLKITDRNQQPVVGAEVKVVYDMPDMPMSPPEKPVIEKGEGVYEKRVFPGMRGEWQFDTTVKKDTITDTHSKLLTVR